jgi:ParB family chromosome partitioning protein
MMAQRKTIGRTLPTQTAGFPVQPDEKTQVLSLKTGRKVKFVRVVIDAVDVANKTFVRQETNGRDQAALTKESLKEIINTFHQQQFFDCFGVEVDGRIEVLDGSRRRASAIFSRRPLVIKVTSEPLSVDEARQLAKDIQTAREHNLREIGLRLLSLKEQGFSQKDIAQQEGISQAKVTRALQAAAVPQDLIAIFPVLSELSIADYKNLLEIDETLKAKDISREQLIDMISDQIFTITSDSVLAEDEKKNEVMKLITKASQTLISAPAKDKAVVSLLWEFDDKDKYARKRTKGRALSYEFNRLPNKVLEDLDESIQNVLKRHLSE